MARQLILLGAPGSGKGTQAATLSSEHGYSHVSTGDLLRAEIAKGTDLGKKLKSIVDAGDLVDDQTVLELLKANCDVSAKQFIFDGFPRNLDQAKLLDEHILGDVEKLAINFNLDLELIVSRITNRRMAPKSGRIYNLLSNPPKVEGKCDETGEDLIQRKDDNEETVRHRLEVFKATIDPVLEYYESKGLLKTLDASQAQDKVLEDLLKILN